MILAAAALSTLLLASATTPNAAARVACPGAQHANTSISGSDAHSDQISARFAVTADPGKVANHLIGYEYQTYGGKEFIEFNFGPPLQFMDLKRGTSIFDVFETRIALLGITQSSLPQPFNSLNRVTQIERTPCN